tara:strand:- start:156 stop:563 length:408 start_codon:yes stop_codon:yes gene_type:complete
LNCAHDEFKAGVLSEIADVDAFSVVAVWSSRDILFWKTIIIVVQNGPESREKKREAVSCEKRGERRPKAITSKKTNETTRRRQREKEEEEKGRRHTHVSGTTFKRVLFFGERIFGFILKRDILPRKQNVSENGKY